jgi:hypothetical protein
MDIYQAGHERAVAQINYFRAVGMRNGRAGFRDTITLDEHFAGRDDAAGFDIEQARGVENGRVRGSGPRLSGRGGMDGKDEEHGC